MDFNTILSEPVYIIGIAAATLLFIIALITLAFTRRQSKLRNTFLMVGLSDSGKTKMYCRLMSDSDIPTFTSQTENVVSGLRIDSSSDSSTITLIDVPGVDRIRKPRLQHWLGKIGQSSIDLTGIITVIDSTLFVKQARDVAEMLYDIMLMVKGKRILVAANKHDVNGAKGAKLIRQLLTNEFNLLQQSRSAQLTMTDGSSNATHLLNIKGDSFDWERDGKYVQFVECSCTAADDAAGDATDGLASVKKWICGLN